MTGHTSRLCQAYLQQVQRPINREGTISLAHMEFAAYPRGGLDSIEVGGYLEASRKDTCLKIVSCKCCLYALVRVIVWKDNFPLYLLLCIWPSLCFACCDMLTKDFLSASHFEKFMIEFFWCDRSLMAHFHNCRTCWMSNLIAS